jgi:hypothetical protein
MRSRWFSLRIRDLFFLITIAAILVGWQLDRRKLVLMYNPQAVPVDNWQVEQVLGKPDTKGQGDIPTAWASATRDNSEGEWLEVGYSWFVKPKSIEIHETFNPGAVTKVTMFDWRGREQVVWEGTANVAGRQSPTVNTIPVSNTFLTRRIKLYIDSPAVPGWNEIDAVGINDHKGRKYWAFSATASSCYDEIYRGVGSENSISGGFFSAQSSMSR